jgi:hypothetical protein
VREVKKRECVQESSRIQESSTEIKIPSSSEFKRIQERRDKNTNLFPEQTLPGGEERALEECVLQNTFDTAQRLDHIGTVVVQRPELTVVTTVCPPEHVYTQRLIALEIGANTPTLVVGQCVTILLEECVDLQKKKKKRERRGK